MDIFWRYSDVTTLSKLKIDEFFEGKMDCFSSRDTDEKIVTVALKIVFLTCRFFCWLALEHLYRCEEKNLDISFEFWGKNWKNSNFRVFFVSKCKISSSETHIAPESPRNFFAEFDTPISVQSGTSVDLSGSWRSFSHFWPFLATFEKCHFW